MRLWRTIKNHLLPWRGNAHRPHILRKQWLVAFLLVALVSEAVVVGRSLISEGPNIFLAAVVRSDVIAYTDTARVSVGGQTLRESDVLDAAAQAKADDMAAKGYFSHVDPAGEQPWAWFDRAGYNYRYAGENLAVKFNDSKEVVDAWMASPIHRANIVKSQYQETGVGIASGTYQGQPATFVVQFFASPSLAQAASPAVAEAAPAQLAQTPAQKPVTAAQAPAQSSQATVAGAQAGPAPEVEVPAVPVPKPTWEQSFMRAMGQIFGGSRTTATWALASIAAILLTVLALTFFIRIQVQPTDLLIPGIAVALVAVILLGANAKFLPGASQSASVTLAGAGDIDSAAATERVNVAFPEAPAR